MSGILQVLMGAGGVNVANLAAQSRTAQSPIGGAASVCTLNFLADGTVTWTGASILIGASSAQWLTSIGSGYGAPFWVRVNVTSGGMSTGTVSTWLSMAGTNSFSISVPNPSNSTVTFTVLFATDAAGANVVYNQPGWTLSGTHV